MLFTVLVLVLLLLLFAMPSLARCCYVAVASQSLVQFCAIDIVPFEGRRTGIRLGLLD